MKIRKACYFYQNPKNMANPIWIMTSAFDQLNLDQTIEKAAEIGVQGLDLCVFRKDGTRDDFVATHLDYENFGVDQAKALIDKFNGGPVGLTTIATAIGENAGTLEEVYEPFLIQEGFLMRTTRGRKATERAYKHLGKDLGWAQGGLFT